MNFSEEDCRKDFLKKWAKEIVRKKRIEETPIIKEMKIYTCPFCRKYYKRKIYADDHIIYCGKNPKNMHICFSCDHLEYDKNKSIEFRFFCKKKNRKFYTYIAERNGITMSPNFDEGGDMFRMPLNCKEFRLDSIFIGYGIGE